ncbi:hypothetical protein PA10_00037 [Pseudomonas phage pPa_SNUABM_DT01]|nr:hypothetical protein PA10_00037 [Pseudomonas phage pPa_SNUABM_DT01]
MRTFLLAGGPPAKKLTLVNGQQYFTTVGTFEWTCPDNVYSISLAMVGAGGGARSSSSAALCHNGRGGNVRYINDIPVTPGEKYTIVVPPGGGAGAVSGIGSPATAFGYSSEDPLGGKIQGMDAAPTYLNSPSIGGGNAGGLAPANNEYGFNIKTWTQYTVRPAGYNWPAVRTGSDFGGGGGSYNAGPGYPYNHSAGGKGAVRIIWGPNRAYPSTNIGDL